MKKNFFLCLVLLVCWQPSEADDADSTRQKSSHYAGLGFGLPYGGIGGRYVFRPLNYLALTAGVGYNLFDVGYNVGVIGSLPVVSNLQVYVATMYGTNAVIIVDGADNYNGSYTGFSVAAGVQVVISEKPSGFLDLGLIIPARNQSFKNDWDGIKDSGLFEIKNDPWPVLLTIGYNFRL
jgi:hypothetical protein